MIHKISIILWLVFILLPVAWAEDPDKTLPITVNGDVVEFQREEQKIVAEGNVEIKYGTAILTCNKITVFTNTKDVIAEGNVKLQDEKGVITGKNIVYNFDKKTGKFYDTVIRSDPYYGFSSEVEKFPNKFILNKGYVTTCNLDKPHYRLRAKQIEIIPNDKIRARGVAVLAGNVPIGYIPYFEQSLKDKRSGTVFTPGQSKEWGGYLLTATRFYLSDNVRGLARIDWRTNKGLAGGGDLEWNAAGLGDSYLRYYHVKEALHGKGEVEPIFKDDDRYKLEYRQKWDTQDNNHLIVELNNYSDINFLKNYFYRQYEKDSQPKNYMLLSHNYSNSTLSLLTQKRLNHFYSEVERLPEIKYETNKQRISSTSSVYYKNLSSAAALNSRTANSDVDQDVGRVDTYNELSRPFRMAFLDFSPYSGFRNTYYSKDNSGEEQLLRNIFYTGCDVSTKFYRMFNAEVDTWLLDVKGLRHVVTPSIKYAYIHQPTVNKDKLMQFDEIDAITKQNRMGFGLENKLQTKRGGQSVDFMTFLVESDYDFKLEGYGGRFQDVNFDLEMLPNSFLRFESDAGFDMRNREFKTANFDVIFSPLGENRIGAGYRYSREEDSKLLNFTFQRRLSPKWKFSSYQRFECRENKFEEHEYSLIRDLHCWEMEFSVNSKRKHGMTFWIIFRLKAFPDAVFNVEKSLGQPKTREGTY